MIDVVNAGDRHMEGYTYTPYGELWWPKEPTEFVPFRFAQGYMDTETGLQKHGVRYYDPAQARFTQMDPLFGKTSDPVTLNQYQYGGCNPTNNSDPSGREHVGEATYETLEFIAGCVPGAEYGFLAGTITPFPVAGPIVGAVTGCLIGGFTAMFIGVGLFDA